MIAASSAIQRLPETHDGVIHRTISGDELRDLAMAGGRAPSGDNAQPWRFEMDVPEGSLEIILEPTHDLSPMNVAQRMSLIACGAALENVVTLAQARGWQTDVQKFAMKDPASPARVARIQFMGHHPQGDSTLAEHVIAERVSNRRIYDARPLPPVVLYDLEQIRVDTHCMEIHWLSDRSVLTPLAGLIARADTLLFSQPEMRTAFLKKVRFDLPQSVAASEGLPLASLQLGAVDRAALRLMPYLPDWFFRLIGAARVTGAHSQKLVLSASGVCLVVPREKLPHEELRAGQAAQCAWLALTELGLAAQPMMSLLVLKNALHYGSSQQISGLQIAGVPALLTEFEAFLDSQGIAHAPCFMLRFGYAPAPDGRTGRRGLGNRI